MTNPHPAVSPSKRQDPHPQPYRRFVPPPARACPSAPPIRQVRGKKGEVRATHRAAVSESRICAD